MGVEIERKFLVLDDGWRSGAGPGRRFCQGNVAKSGTAGVRIRRADQKAYLTIKGPKAGMSRAEFEYEIPVDDAEDMLLTMCRRPLLEKTRYCVRHEGVDWEVDVFVRPAKGLVLTEVELHSEQQRIALPSWVGKEVTHDPSYGNSAIAGIEV